MTTTKMTKEQEEGFERYMECVRGLYKDQVSRLAAREYGSVLEKYEELKKEMLIKHERDQKRIAELKAQVAARKEEIARKDALKKELELQLSSSRDSNTGKTKAKIVAKAMIFDIAIERCFRHIANGRRNWQQAGSHEAADNLAFMYSLYESCKMNKIGFVSPERRNEAPVSCTAAANVI